MTKGRREGSRRHPNLDQTFMTAVHAREGDVKTFVIENQWSKRCCVVEGNSTDFSGLVTWTVPSELGS